jgi:dTDP-4-dehydrorhamnose reductase
MVTEIMERIRPEIVIHTAAFTDVDSCETNAELAMEINAVGAGHVAEACGKVGARMIYYSSDYVFDGMKRSPYLEMDSPNPRSVYGLSKLAGEKQVAEKAPNHAILRIAWLYGAQGRNFPRTMVRMGLEQIKNRAARKAATPIKVVNDQIGNPTWTQDVVRQTEIVIRHNLEGIYHCTSEGEVSWYGFAREIFNFLNIDADLVPCTTDEYRRPAPRPKYSCLENHRLNEAGLNVMRNYRAALVDFLEHHGGALLSLNA